MHSSRSGNGDLPSGAPGPASLRHDPASPIFSLTIVICSRDRPGSLASTLESLARADQRGIAAEIVVVNNGGPRETDEIVLSFSSRLNLQLLHEPLPGKAHALNRALEECALREIAAVLDDDITVSTDWFQGVRRLCERWPDKGFFTGRTRIDWPPGELPVWAHDSSLCGWAFSVVDPTAERLIPEDRWVSGNHFWFRSACLPEGFRFDTSRVEGYVEMAEPKLMLDLAAAGFGGVASPEAEAVHHLQPELINVERLERRAMEVGRGFARARLIPFRPTVKQAVLFRRFPRVARLFCYVNLGRWQLCLICARLSVARRDRVLRRFRALERAATYREYLRIAHAA